MSESKLVAAQLLCSRVESATSQLCAQTARVGVFFYVKNDSGNVRLNELEINAALGAQLRNGGLIRPLAVEKGVNGDSGELVVDTDETAQLCKPHKQDHTVLAARYSNSNMVAVLYHIKFLYSLPHISQHSLNALHNLHSNDRFYLRNAAKSVMRTYIL